MREGARDLAAAAPFFRVIEAGLPDGYADESKRRGKRRDEDMAMAPPESSAVLRSSNGFSETKTMPELDELVKPLIDSPGNAMACSTPGCFSAISLMGRYQRFVQDLRHGRSTQAKRDRSMHRHYSNVVWVGNGCVQC